MKKIILSTIFLLTWRYWEIEGRPPQTKPGCCYEGKRYQEAERVNTREPCLDCRCTEGSLRCRLRVCPRLANPVASGCTIGGSRTPRADACCPELVCGESGESHVRNVTARRDPSKEFGPHDNGCVHEGVRYGPGSAMMGSRRCEYCYCISGKRRCLRPRCLLPLAGCIPLYAPYSCCPVAYNCTNSSDDSFPSVVSGSSRPKYGCRVGEDRTYEEGEMVREPGWKGRCENCFCAMGAVRCVPLSCAPPLQGCTPIIPRGQCCPSTYNCSGTIEVKANQNYASYAFISKDYAKFKKETNFFSMRTVHEESMDNSEARGHNSPDLDGDLMEKEDPMNLGSTLGDAVTGRTTEMLNRTSSVHLQDEGSSIVGQAEGVATATAAAPASPKEENEIPTEAATIEASSNYRETTTMTTTTTATTTTTTTTTMDETTETAIGTSNLETTLKSELSTSAELVDDGNGFATRDNALSSKVTSSLIPSQVSVTKDPTSLDRTIHQEQEKTVALVAFASESNKKTEEEEEEEEKSWTRTSTAIAEITTLQRQSFGGTAESSSVISVKGPAAAAADDDDDDDRSPSNVLMPNNMYVINVTLRTNVSVGHIQQAGVTINPVRSVQPDIAALLDITNRKKGEEDYEYEYAEPTLPPSLPNLRIIPFVAADALVKQEEDVSLSHVTNYPLGSGVGRPPQELGLTLASSGGAPDNFYDAVTQNNRFSPPVETEGGFVPREPSYFDQPYRSTDQNLQVRTSVTVVPADMTNSHRQNDEMTGICVFENRNYGHGDILPSSGHCIICICYYGEVACSDEKCPPLKIGCRRLNNDKICCGKIICVDAKESPTVVLDRADAIASPPRAPLPSLDGIASPDPFRDVIKTKPAPDLPSLIEDMKPYLVEHRITKPVTETTTTAATTATPSSKLPVVTDIRPDRRIVDANQNGSKRVENGTCTGGKTSESVTGDENQGNTSQGIGWKVATASSSEGLTEPSGPDESSILSLGGVLDLIFSTEAKGAEDSAAKTEMTTRTMRKPPHSPTSQLPSPLPDLAQSDLSLYRADPVGGRNETTIDSGPQSTVSPDAWDGFKGYSSSSSSSSSPPSSQSSIATGSSSLESSVTAASISSIKVEEPSSLERARVPDSSVTATTADDEIVTLVSGLLKLAGCNIYGKMYRVGKIITELSSPCLECRCTELGVQCKQLDC